MSITYFSKRCPGAQRLGFCSWSTDLLGQPASICSERVLCEVCMVIEGMDGSRELLQKHLTEMYIMDTDQFRKVRVEICDRAFDAVSSGVLKVLTGDVPTSKRAREDQRREYLTRTLSLLTNGSWIIHCWTKRFAEDTQVICRCEVAIGHLPVQIRGSIYEFVCSDAWKLYTHLCSVKRRAYHTLEQPIFWHPPYDFHERNTDGDPAIRAMLVGVYSYIVKHVHKPKLQSLKRSLVKHTHLIKRNVVMKKRCHLVQNAIKILDSMLVREIKVVGAAPFGLGSGT